MLGGILAIVGILLTGKVTMAFVRKLKGKLGRDIVKRYRFWLAEGAIFILSLGFAVSMFMGGLINGAGTGALLPALKFGALLFAFFSVVALLRLLIARCSTKQD